MVKKINSTFLSQDKDVVDRSVEYYKQLQKRDPNAIEQLVSRLNQGERVPFPCDPNPNIPCGAITTLIPHSFSPYLMGIADDFKVCGSGKYYIFFSRRTKAQPYLIWSFYVTNILQDRAGNVYSIEGTPVAGEPSSSNSIENIMGEGLGQWALKALQC